MSRSCLWSIVVALAAAGCVRVAAAQSPVGTPGPGEEAILAALAEPAELEFFDTPLADVAAQLSQRHHIPVLLDVAALNSFGAIGTGTLVSASLDEMSLESALTHLLRPYGWAWRIDHDALLITTQPAADAAMETRLYEVADLAAQDQGDCSQLAAVLAFGLGSPLVAVTPADIISGVAAPGAGPGVLSYHNVLVVRHNQAGHRALARLLAELRAALGLGLGPPGAPQAEGTTESPAVATP